MVLVSMILRESMGHHCIDTITARSYEPFCCARSQHSPTDWCNRPIPCSIVAKSNLLLCMSYGLKTLRVLPSRLSLRPWCDFFARSKPFRCHISNSFTLVF